MNTKKLYHFLMENECHLYKEKDTIKAWACVHFWQLQEFAEILGRCAFDDGGLDVKMFEDYLAVNIDDLIEGYDEDLNDYKECFGDEWDDYF